MKTCSLLFLLLVPGIVQAQGFKLPPDSSIRLNYEAYVQPVKYEVYQRYQTDSLYFIINHLNAKIKVLQELYFTADSHYETCDSLILELHKKRENDIKTLTRQYRNSTEKFYTRTEKLMVTNDQLRAKNKMYKKIAVYSILGGLSYIAAREIYYNAFQK